MALCLPASMAQIPELQTTATARAARPAQFEPAPPRVGPWELVRLIGQGQLAHVYEARPVGSAVGKPTAYALKMLRDPWDRDPQGLDTLRREAHLGRAVTNPHLVPILAADTTGSKPYVVMPLLEGRTLKSRLAAGEPPDLPVVLWIVRQVAEALSAMHQAGWMHSDVKPSNIFLSSGGHATLIDLGFARRLEEMAQIASRPVLGTAKYIAPEMLSATTRADGRSDIYSLGMTLFEMLTGRLPFDSEDVVELAQHHRQTLPPPIRALAPHVSLRVGRLVRQMLAKEPLRRPQTARELIDRLAKLEIESFGERLASETDDLRAAG